MNFSKISSRMFSLICLMGFLLQVQQVSELYFRFQTTSKTIFQIRDDNKYLSVMYCPRSIDLLDRRNHKKYDISPTLPPAYDKMLLELSNLTIKDILELTPEESDAILHCDVRHGTVSTVILMNQKKCDAFFKVIKSVSGERICYAFIPNSLANYSAGDVASSFTHLNSIYVMLINPSISKSSYAAFISSVMDPDGSLKDVLHSRLFQSFTENQKTFNESRFSIFGDSIEIYRVPPPYDTGCTPGHNRETCYEDCLTDKFRTINRIPWSGFHTKKLDLKMLTPIDYLNKTISMFANESFEKCYFRCKHKTECVTQFSRTTIQEYQSSQFYFASVLPSQPHMSVYAIPVLNVVEYIVQVGSCFGMWFGLSIITLNPIQRIKQIIFKDSKRVVRSRHPRLFKLTKNRRNENREST